MTLAVPLHAVLVVGLPLLLSPVAYLFGRYLSPRLSGVLSHATMGIQLLLLLLAFPTIYAGGVLEDSFSWIPELGLTFTFELDQLSYPFVLITAIVGLIVSAYSWSYMRGAPRLETYYALYMLFVSGITGVFLAKNLFIFYIFWELMLIPSYFLIALWGTGDARTIGFKYFAMTHVGALSLLAGIIWLNSIYGSVGYEVLEASARVARPELVYVAILVFIGIAFKMAVVPFHTWLPDAYAEAPTPISALMGGVMINTGIYAFARILVGFLNVPFATIAPAVLILGLIAMYWGGAMALVQHDLKRVIAYSSVSQMGYVLFGLSMLNPIGFAGAVFHALTHGFAKAMLFLSAGAVIYRLQERDVLKLGGLARTMPITAVTFLIGSLSIAGAPPLAGFFSEWMLFAGGFAAGYTGYTVIAVAATALTLSYFLRAFTKVFLGSKGMDARDPPMSMTIGINVLSLLLVVLGFLGAPILYVITLSVPPNL